MTLLKSTHAQIQEAEARTRNGLPQVGKRQLGPEGGLSVAGAMKRQEEEQQRAMSRLCLLLIASLIAACGAPTSPEYFPLESGQRWEYRVHEKKRLVDRVDHLSLRNRSVQLHEGQPYMRRLASDGNDYWIALHDTSVQRAGLRTAIDFAPRMDATPRTVLQLPPAVGQSWEVETRPYILERAEPFRERFSQDHSKRIVLRMQVASLDDVVQVPAGTFTRCLQLEGSGLLNVLADARIGASPVPVTHTEWYAPGVGLVKLERTESLDTQQIVGGKVSMELLRFDD